MTVLTNPITYRIIVVCTMVLPLCLSCSTKRTTTTDVQLQSLTAENLFRTSATTITTTTFQPITIDTTTPEATNWAPIKRHVTQVTHRDTTTATTDITTTANQRTEATAVKLSPASTASHTWREQLLFLAIIIALLYLISKR